RTADFRAGFSQSLAVLCVQGGRDGLGTFFSKLRSPLEDLSALMCRRTAPDGRPALCRLDGSLNVFSTGSGDFRHGTTVKGGHDLQGHGPWLCRRRPDTTDEKFLTLHCAPPVRSCFEPVQNTRYD